ncbi:hypothetical protein CR513_06319, partial [Mucuna pruriens]
MLIRTRKNKYDMLKDENGEWVKDPQILESKNTIFIPFKLSNAFLVLEDGCMHDLSITVMDDEIYQIARRMGSFKAPRPNGSQSLVRRGFEDPKIVAEVSGTLITLIPKIEGFAKLALFLHTGVEIIVDQEKAYDGLKWAFIKEILEDFGCLGHLVNIILSCISSLFVRLLWNGEALERFTPSRGIY